MKNKMLKIFAKNKIVIVNIITESGRVVEHVFNVKQVSNGKIKIDDSTYIYKMEDILNLNGIPTLFYHQKCCKPVNFYDLERNPEITSEEFNTAINNSVVRELMASGVDNKNEQLLLMGVGISSIGIMITGYLVYTQSGVIAELMTKITELQQLVNTLINIY